jgi:hypothetical protein
MGLSLQLRLPEEAMFLNLHSFHEHRWPLWLAMTTCCIHWIEER